MPPRRMNNMDRWRQWLCFGGMIAVVAVTAMGFSLAVASVLLVMCLVVVKALTLEEVYGFMNGPLLLTIAASFGLGKAIERSGLARLIAGTVLDACSPFGPYGAVFGIYACTTVIG